MNKKIKNLFLAAFVLTGLAGMTESCNKDEINSLNDRVTKVENALADLQTQITNGAVITNVESIANGVKVTLSDGTSFNLTNGKDGADGQDGANGQDGADGQDGSVVTIGDNGNWFIDGVDTGFPSRGDKGDKGDQGEPGAPGADGQDGQDGAPGAPGADGQDGADGEDGADAPIVYYYPETDPDSEFCGEFVKVTIYPDGTEEREGTGYSFYVPGTGKVNAIWDTDSNTLTLLNVEGAGEEGIVISLNATLKSLAFVPKVVKDGYGLIEALYLDEKNPETGKYDFITSNKVQATYRANPSNIDVEGIDFSFIARTVETRATNDIDDFVTGTLVDSEDGLVFDLSATDQRAFEQSKKDDNIKYFVALKAAFDGEEIVSDYAFFTQTYVDVADLSLVRKDLYEKGEAPVTFATKELSEIDPLLDPVDMDLVYGQELDLKDYIIAYHTDYDSRGDYLNKSLEDLGFEGVQYRITLPEKYEILSVNHNASVSLSEDGIITVKEGTSNIGKTPVVKVEAYIVLDGKEKVLASAYIKFEIVPEAAEPAKPLDPVSPLDLIDFGDVDYLDLTPGYSEDGVYYTVSTADFNAILDAIGLTNEGFWSAYYWQSGQFDVVDKNGDIVPGIIALPTGYTGNIAGAEIYIVLTSSMKYGEGPKEAKVVLTPYDDTENPVVEIPVKYNIVHDEDACWPAFDASYVVNNEAKVKGVMENGEWVLKTALKEHFEDAAEAEDITFSLPKLDEDGNVDEKNGEEQTGLNVSGATFTVDDVLEYTGEGLSADKTYVIRMTRTHDNLMSHSKDYKVTFMVPFKTTVSAVSLTDGREADSEDITKSITITEVAGGNKVYEKGKVNSNNTYGLTDASFEITTSLAKGETEPEGFNLDSATNTVTWKNDGTLLQAPKTVNLVVSVKINGIYTSETPVTVTINPAE